MKISDWPKISVLTPTLDSSQTLEQCLESIINQDYPKNKLEIIIADGGSNDNTLKIAQKYNARVYIDEAHGLGVLGEHGRGVCEYWGLEDKVDLVMGTFSKSLASIGGFVVGSRAVIDYIKHSARALIFTAAPPPAATAAALKALEIIEQEPERIKKLNEISRFMHHSLKDIGFDIGKSNHTPIIPLYIYDDIKTMYFWKQLFNAGLFTNAVLPPGVPPKQSLIRTSYMATHTKEDLNQALEILEKIASQKKTALMCAEAYYGRCHRRFIIKYLQDKGWKVSHI